IEHQFGILHSPSGQAIIERSHQTLKRTLARQKGDLRVSTPQERLAKALFTISFLNCSFECLNLPVLHHFNNSAMLQFQERPPVLVKDPATLETGGPYPLV
ncbi:POK10 protein, partial [Dicaeum eximium]|nr:POK10 protein [Dicaeum eximium]